MIAKRISELLAREGGYSNHPADKGGETCWGITVAVARANGYGGDMRVLSQTVAQNIYNNEYWLKPGFEVVNQLTTKVAEELFDTGVNCGVGTASRLLQRSLNLFNLQGTLYADLPVDGSIGPKTLTALAAYLKTRGPEGETVLLRALNCLQGMHYIDIAEANKSQEAFIYGWLSNRVGV